MNCRPCKRCSNALSSEDFKNCDEGCDAKHYCTPLTCEMFSLGVAADTHHPAALGPYPMGTLYPGEGCNNQPSPANGDNILKDFLSFVAPAGSTDNGCSNAPLLTRHVTSNSGNDVGGANAQLSHTRAQYAVGSDSYPA